MAVPLPITNFGVSAELPHDDLSRDDLSRVDLPHDDLPHENLTGDNSLQIVYNCGEYNCG